jgi:hypothetical protein
MPILSKIRELIPFQLRRDQPRLIQQVVGTDIQMQGPIYQSLTSLMGAVASTPVSKEPKMSFLATIGKDFKAVFAWLGSSQGQAVVTAGENVAVTVATAAGVGAPVIAGINLINSWMSEAIKTEALAAAAGAQTGSGAQKSAAVLATMIPELTAYLQNKGYTTANVTATATTINNAIVGLLNTLEAPDGTIQAQNTATPTA